MTHAYRFSIAYIQFYLKKKKQTKIVKKFNDLPIN